MVSDLDSANVTVSLTLSDPAAGALNSATAGSVTSSFTAGVWTAAGNIADVNTLLAGLDLHPGRKLQQHLHPRHQRLRRHRPSPHRHQDDDQHPGQRPAGGHQLVRPRDLHRGHPLNLTDIVVSDLDSANVTVSLTLSDPAAGALNSATAGSVTSSFTAGVWTAAGNIADVNTLLAGLTFTPAANYNSTFTLATSVSDGIAPALTGTKTMTSIPVNDPPVATNLSAPETYTEDTPLNLTDIVVSDLDSANVTVSLTLSDPAAGALNSATAGSVTSSFTAGVWTAAGNIADVNTLLAGLTFTPAANYNSTFTLATSVSDGIAPALTGTKTMTSIPVNDPPVATNLSAPETYTEDTPLNLTDIVVSDLDSANVTVSLTLSDPAAGALNSATAGSVTSSFTAGVWTAAGNIADVNTLLAGLTFTPAANYNSTFTLATSVSDGIAPALTGTKTMTSIPVNDPPVANDDAATVNQDSGANTTDVLANDSILPDAGETLTITAVTQGANGAVAIVGGTTVTYTPNATFSGVDSFTYVIDDGNGGTATATVSVTVNNVNNDPPVNAIPGAQITAEDTPLVFSIGNGNAISVSDPDAGASPLQVTLTATQGTLTLAGVAGVTFSVGDGTADATMTFTGSQASINAALNGMSFTPSLNYDGPATISISTNDLGASGIGGPMSSPTDTVDIAVVVVNDPPVVTVTGAPAYTENGPGVLIAPTTTVTDIDSTNLAWFNVAIVVPDGTFETLSANTTGTSITAAYNSGTGVLTLNGADTVANYQQVLRTVLYASTSDAPNPSAVISFVASDDGVSLSNIATTTVTINRVNDAPTADIAAASYSATENSPLPLALAGTGITVGDVDAGTLNVAAQISVISGFLTANANGVPGLIVSGSGTPTVTLIGTVTRINDFLAGNSGQTLNYVVASDSPPPVDFLGLGINDLGHTGSGGPLTAFDSAPINVTAVNDAPLNTLPGTATTPEDTPLVFSAAGGNQISITDVDAGGGLVDVTLAATNGTLTLAGTANLSFQAGADGTASMTVRGTTADINTALNGLAFTPNANYNGTAFLTLSTNDRGNSGLGGPLSDADLCAITVTPVNDAPSGTNGAFTMLQDTTRVLTVADFGFTDPDVGDTMGAVRIDGLSFPGAATLQLAGSNVTAGQVIPVSAITAGSLVFTPAPGASGAPYAGFAFSVRDSAGAFAPTPNTMTVNVTPAGVPGVSVTPTAGLVTTEAGGTATFSVVLDTQPAADVTIALVSSDTTEGTVAPASLTFTSADWNVPQVVTVTGVADGIPDGSVAYTIALAPATSADPNYDGSDPADVSVTNVEVNAPPTVTILQPSYTATEGMALALAGTGLSVADVDAGAWPVTVTLSVNAGLLNVSAPPAVAVAGSGTPVVTLVGNIADINGLLAGSGAVDYIIGSNTPPATDARLCPSTTPIRPVRSPLRRRRRSISSQ